MNTITFLYYSITKILKFVNIKLKINLNKSRGLELVKNTLKNLLYKDVCKIKSLFN